MIWSISAHNVFRRCQRQYFFSQIMASHNSNDSERREAFILKQLQSLRMWLGSLVHKGIQNYVVPCFTSGSLPDRDDVIRKILTMADRQFAFSSSCQYRIKGQSKRSAGDIYCALFEHEYGITITSQKLREVRDSLSLCLCNLLDRRDFLDQLRRHSDHCPEFVTGFRLAGARVVVRLDLLCFQCDRMPVIVDWKVAGSESSEYSHQAMTYVLSLLRSPIYANIHAEGISVYEVNLLTNKIKPHIVTEKKVLETENFIFQSIEEMKALAGDGKFKSQHIEDYELAGNIMTCMYCNFRKLCMRMIK